MNIIALTDRLYLREFVQDDFQAVCRVLQDKDVMYAYEHAFTDEEAHAWLDNQVRRYREDGCGLWAVILKETETMIGQCGLTRQQLNGKKVLEVGYLFEKEYWHRGYATEASRTCISYAFDMMEAKRVYAIIRENNLPSQKVALRNGMRLCGKTVKHYYGIDMPHLVYRITEKENFDMDIAEFGF